MAPVQEAMRGKGADIGDTIGMSSKNQRPSVPDLGRPFGRQLSARELEARQHYVTPSNQENLVNEVQDRRQLMKSTDRNDPIPYYYNQYDGLPVPYSAPSAQKENFVLRSAVRDAAGAEVKQRGQGGVIRTDPITDEEVAYLKSMKDQAELAKFDDYVESFINPRQPGNMKFLMEVYPDYVNRRLQQAHTDYEFALRNQMIDSWGINTFEDLHFKYLVDQGKITGPRLLNRRPRIDDTYTPGWLSPFNFQSPRKTSSDLRLPFASAQHGRRPLNVDNWTMDRSNRPLGTGNTEQQLARGMYAAPDADPANQLPTGSDATNIGRNFFVNGGFYERAP